jgi:uncharacterized protein DUF4388
MRALLQALSAERATAVVTIQSGVNRGAVYFSDGVLIHALAGTTMGDQALRQALQWTDGRFRLVREAVVQPRTITQPLASFLDGAHGAQASVGAPASDQSARADATLFADLLELLTRLDSDRAHLAEGHIDHGVDGRLAAVAAIVNGVVTFVTARRHDPDAQPEVVLARMSATQPYAQMLGGDNESISIGAVAAALQNWRGDIVERERMAQVVGEALVDVLMEYCRIAGALFDGTAEREQWWMTSEVFIEDLRATVRHSENDIKGEGHGQEMRAHR